MDIGYYLSRFWRRMHWFLLVAILIAGAAFVVARELPPTFVSDTQLLVEAAQIEDASLRLSPEAQMQIVRERLLTRSNLLDIARRRGVFENVRAMTPDDIVDAMLAATNVRLASGRNVAVTQMTVAFTARRGQIAADVLNDYLTIIQQEDVDISVEPTRGRVDFFDDEVDRLAALLQRRSQAILDFQNSNADALPETLNARLEQQSTTQERLLQIERDVSTLSRQREQTIRLFEAGIGAQNQQPQLSPAEQELANLRRERQAALITFSESSARVRALDNQIRLAEAAVEAEKGADEDTVDPVRAQQKALLDIQIAEIDAKIDALATQKAELEARQEGLEDVLSRIPANQITLAGLEREYQNVRSQYDAAVARQAQAATSEQIQAKGRGQRIVVIDPPAVPSQPTGPNRLLIAGGGAAFGILSGLALVVLLELLNSAPMRPRDITAKLGVTPLATIPFVPTTGQTIRRRALKLAVIAAGLVLGPLALWLVHAQYRPLDLLLRDVMRALGM